jgi:hypothetical protein
MEFFIDLPQEQVHPDLSGPRQEIRPCCGAYLPDRALGRIIPERESVRWI